MSDETKNTIQEENISTPLRKHPLTVISLNTFTEYEFHKIQQNSSWGSNPYVDYAEVPDDMVEAILTTRGFCDIVIVDGKVAEFTALEIPEIPEPEPEPTEIELQWQAITDLEIAQMEYDQALTDLEIA